MAIDISELGPIDIGLTAFIILAPVLIVIYPYILLRGSKRGTAASLYGRFALGYIVVWFGYFLFPAFVLEHDYETTENRDRNGFFFYLIRMYTASLLLYLQFPLRIFPFIFILAPALSFMILLIRLKRDRSPEPLIEKLKMLNFEFEQNPMELTKERLDQKNWKNERELLIAMVAILPISLYLLTMFLSVLEYADTAVAFQKALGWFLEVFFVYLALGIFCIHLIYSNRLSFKGEYLGARLRRSMIESLSTVGAFVSVIAVVFFLVEKEKLLLVSTYFFVYFLMASILLILFLDIFEPISIFILTKFIEFFAATGTRRSRVSIRRLIPVAIGGVIIGILGYLVRFGGVIVQNQMLGSNDIGRAFTDENTGLNVAAPIYHMLNTLYMTFSLSWSADILQIFVMCTGIVLLRRYNDSIMQNITIVFLVTILMTPFLSYEFYLPLYDYIYDEFGVNLKYQSTLGKWIGDKFTAQVLLLDISRSQVYWVSSVGVLVNWRNFPYAGFSGRLTQVDVTGAFPPVLELAYIPFLYLAPLGTLALFALIIHFADSKFHVFALQKDQTIEKSVYSSIHYPNFRSIRNNPDRYLVIQKSKGIPLEIPENAVKVLDELKGGQFTFSVLAEQTSLDIRILHKSINTIKRLAPDAIDVYRKEYGFTYETVHIDSVHVMMTDGRSVFTWQPSGESLVEPALVAGLFAAITSFAKEAVHSEQMLKTIDHGDVVLTIEYGQWVFMAVFANKGSAQLRRSLKNFMVTFEEKHADELPGWLGDMEPFEKDQLIAEKAFEEIVN